MSAVPAANSTDILVHSAAPSRGQDDARYRALAAAYEAFEPLSRSRLSLAHVPVSETIIEAVVTSKAAQNVHDEEPRWRGLDGFRPAVTNGDPVRPLGRGMQQNPWLLVPRRGSKRRASQINTSVAHETSADRSSEKPQGALLGSPFNQQGGTRHDLDKRLLKKSRPSSRSYGSRTNEGVGPSRLECGISTGQPLRPTVDVSGIPPLDLRRQPMTNSAREEHLRHCPSVNPNDYPPSDLRPLDSPPASFAHVQHNLTSPALPRHQSRVAAQEAAETPLGGDGSWMTPPSVVDDSQPTYDRMVPALSTPTRILQLFLQNLPSPSEHGSQPRAGPAQSSEALDQERRRPCRDGTTVDDGRRGSEAGNLALGKSRHAGAITKSNFKMRRRRFGSRNLSREGMDINHLEASQSEVTSSAPFASQASQPPDKTTHVDSQTKSRTITITSGNTFAATLNHQVDPPPQVPDHLAATLPLTTASKTTKLPLIALPPNPHTNTTIPGPRLTNTLISPSLLKLATDLRLPARYRPSHTLRAIDATERGYWWVLTDAWGVDEARADIALRAWGHLVAWIADGKAGWGVWATNDVGNGFIHDDEGAEDDMLHQRGKESQRQTHEQRPAGRDISARIPPLRAIDPTHARHNHSGTSGWHVYCWGGAVAHVWLLVYLVSSRRVKTCGGARWIDADGLVVVSMPLVGMA